MSKRLILILALAFVARPPARHQNSVVEACYVRSVAVHALRWLVLRHPLSLPARGV